MDNDDKEKSIQIGKYKISLDWTYSDDLDLVWISKNNDGEGGQFSLKKLEKVIDEFYKKNF